MPNIVDEAQQKNVVPVRTYAEEKLWSALYSYPHSTSLELSLAAELGRSTVTKILSAWAKEGLAEKELDVQENRRPGPFRWTAIKSIDNQKQNTDGESIDNIDRNLMRCTKKHNPQLVAPQASRLRSGMLREMVEQFLIKQNKELGISSVARSLNKSPGAVHNALEKLVTEGRIIKTQQKPKRFCQRET